MISEQLILLHENDNVLICRQKIVPGQQLVIDGTSMLATEVVDVGHKIARRALMIGEKVVKYGAPIGSITMPVANGRHVHLHNMKSDYIASHTRQAADGKTS